MNEHITTTKKKKLRGIPGQIAGIPDKSYWVGDRKAKIAIVANSTWNIYNFRLNIIELLEENNFEILVIAPVDHYIVYLNRFPKTKHIHLNTLSRKSTNPYKDMVLMWELYKIYKAEKPDIIIHYTVKPNIYGGLAARLCNIKCISAITGLGYTFLHNGLIKSITKRLYRFSFKYSEKVVFENIDDRLLFIKEQITEPEKCLSMKGCGVDINYYATNGYVKQKDTKVFTFIGRLLYDKGIVEFVEAAQIVKQRFPDAQFWVVGEIDHQNPAAISYKLLLEWIKSGVITYHGPTDDVRPFIEKSDCIVFPSYREAIPRVVQEGMAMRKPIITTDTPGCREAVEVGKNGYLVPIKDANALAKAVIEFHELSEEEAMAMGAFSRQKVEREFDDSIISNQYLDIINGILQER